MVVFHVWWHPFAGYGIYSIRDLMVQPLLTIAQYLLFVSQDTQSRGRSWPSRKPGELWQYAVQWPLASASSQTGISKALRLSESQLPHHLVDKAVTLLRRPSRTDSQATSDVG